MSLASYSIAEISKLISEWSHLQFSEQIINTLLIDSRKVTNANEALFFILKGRKDAHQYIHHLYHTEGIRSFVYYDKNFDISAYPEANFLYTKNTLAALQQLASYHRSKFDYPVLAITGSNGKTVVKEWLFQLMSLKYNIVRSPKSYNSQIGVPLSVWQMDQQYNYGIFEAGISKPGEMEKLERILQPSVGIFTNIGASHDEGFTDRTHKIKEKFKLFKNVDVLICNSEYMKYSECLQTFTWSLTDKKADLLIVETEIKGSQTQIKARCKNEDIAINIPFSDKAAVENAITCWSFLLAIGIPQNLIAARIEHLQPVKMRLELKSGINGTSIIDDSYNSDLLSLEIALDFLTHQKQHLNKRLILSDIQQSGLTSEQLYQKVADLLTEKNINSFIGIGKEISLHKHLFNPDSVFFEDTTSFLTQFNPTQFKNETILLKGAREFGFEKISKVLGQKVHETILEINLNAMEHNLNYYRSKLMPGVKLMTMVKAFGYGSGSFEIANLLQFNHVDYLAVAYADEGIALRQAGITLPIMVMNPELSAAEVIVKNRLEPEIFSDSFLRDFSNYLKSQNLQNYPVHFKVDTGMHRLGFEATEAEKIAIFIKEEQTVRVQSVLSHLAASEAPEHDDFTRNQIAVFKNFCDSLEKEIGYSFIKHICNTAAISRWPDAQFDMVRLGIGLYGVDSLTENKGKLQQVATLKTVVSQIKKLKKGDTVGYGLHGVMPYDGEIATVKIGYADGYIRALGKGHGSMYIYGQEVFTIGNICMDMCMLDVTGKNVKEGDEVIVFNSQTTLQKMADKLNTIAYEVLTNVSQRVKRVYYYE